MKCSTKILKGRAKENIVGLITVEKFELANAVNSKLNKTWKKAYDRNCWNFARLELRSQVLTCSTFMQSLLVMTWSLTLAGLPRVGAKSKPHDYKQKIQKMKDLPKTWISSKNRLKISDEKKNISSLDQTTAWKTRPVNATNEDGPCNQEELNSTKLEKKGIQIKTVEICNTRTKKPSLDKLNFYLLSAVRDTVTDNDSSNTCRIKVKAPSLKTNTKNERPSVNMAFI